MKLTLLPLLAIQRDLHTLPRGPERFKRYLETLTGGTDAIQVPLVGMNPMAKEHVTALIDELLSWDAEEVTELVLRKSATDFDFMVADLQFGLVLNDDLKGGWTNTYLSDYAQRFENHYDLRHGWALLPIWTSQVWSQDVLSLEIKKALYRSVYKFQHGLPKTLAQMIKQEGMASVYAGENLRLEPEMLAYTGWVIEAYLSSSHKPTCLACLFGDEAAASVGYPVLGLPEKAGFILAYQSLKEQNPLAALEI